MLMVESRSFGIWVVTAQFFQVHCLLKYFIIKGGGVEEVTANREHKGKKRWPGGHGRTAARGRRGPSDNTGASQGQNCKRPS